MKRRHKVYYKLMQDAKQSLIETQSFLISYLLKQANLRVLSASGN